MNLVEQLKRDEGVRYVPYQDSLGYWTCSNPCTPRLKAIFTQAARRTSSWIWYQ